MVHTVFFCSVSANIGISMGLDEFSNGLGEIIFTKLYFTKIIFLLLVQAF